MYTKDILRGTWMEIHLDCLKHNFKELKKKITSKKTKFCAVIKADAYGHGAIQITQTLMKEGVKYFAVATLSEAIELREAGLVDIQILILGHTPKEKSHLLVQHNIIPTIYSYDQAENFSKTAQELNKQMTVHIKIDTGMSRLGFKTTEEDRKIIKRIFKLSNINIEGIYTHFALADEQDKSFTLKQFKDYQSFCNTLEKEGYNIPIKHTSNSAALIDLPQTQLDMVRLGIGLYGFNPNEVITDTIDLKPIMSLKSSITHIKEVEKGTGVSYGHKYVTEKNSTKIGTLPIGYADGLSRLLTNKLSVTFKDQVVPVVGAICMDQCMVDITNTNINLNDEITIYSSRVTDINSVENIAEKLGTISYEVLCMLSKRIPRVYLEDNNVVHIRDDLLK
ncbi:alanine racemase [Serpentinicella sp. ANB-PHB4]|uniref:alanine racemase n=1 Tax=Serpentinicella sp. ANB-PHB4 TaxID=3074076 RepID=UPI00285DC3AF|nr:alanine racemase [Serpentinicella sp. ANB-PHB4]MDR5659351.1 alanine racemase [Serpentinicella sp. ANB-PHB4]